MREPRSMIDPGARGVLALAGAALLAVSLAGCGGAGAGQTVGGGEIERPPDPIPTKSPQDVYNVTVMTPTGQYLVDKLEIEWNRRRGIHEFYGFYRDQYDQMARIPFYALERIDFMGPMPPAIFEQAIIGREQEHLRQSQAFEVRLRFRDGNQETFFAIIPKFRGEKDLQLWEFPMDNRASLIDYIEFDR